mmetsp:Transcript_4860/g.15936  ORF Transcript_4860/g.15936 Transcript_4860/m.15936 type:complete len:271 (+) Transcript_4860:250-1062(+)
MGEAVVQGEGSLLGSFELGHVRERVDGGMPRDVGDQGSDVGASGALDVEGEAGEVDGGDVEGRDADGSRVPRDDVAGARELVEALSVFPQRRVHRRHLLDVPGEGRRRLQKGPARDVAPLLRRDDLARRVEGIRFAAQQRRRFVPLAPRQVGLEPSRPGADAEDQDPRRRRIERPAVAYLDPLRLPLDLLAPVPPLPLERASDLLHHVRRRPVLRLVHRQHAARHLEQEAPAPATQGTGTDAPKGPERHSHRRKSHHAAPRRWTPPPRVA